MIDFRNTLTVQQVAIKLDISEEWVRDLIKSKKIKATKIAKWRIMPEDLEEFVKSRSNI